MTKQRVKQILYRGARVSIDWPARLLAAQLDRHVRIRGKRYTRLCYMPSEAVVGLPCHDCACLPGELHVPGCDMEVCPRCGEQMLLHECSEGETDL